MKNYLDLLRQTFTYGKDMLTRNGIRRTLYGAQLRFDLRDGFPLVTTRYIPFKNPSVEMLWFLRGDTDIRFLHEHKVRIWDANANGDGYVGNAYGYQWRHGFGFDQIAKAVKLLQRDPTSTRNVVLSWHPAQLNATVLPPCHIHFQLHSDGQRLRLQFTMR